MPIRYTVENGDDYFPAASNPDTGEWGVQIQDTSLNNVAVLFPKDATEEGARALSALLKAHVASVVVDD